MRCPGWSLYGRTPYALPRALIAELERDWYVDIRHDVRDVDGNLYVAGGANKGTMCGAFPHGIRTLSSGVFSGTPCYQIAGNRDVSVQLRLVRKHCADSTKWTEQAVLEPSDRYGIGYLQALRTSLMKWGQYRYDGPTDLWRQGPRIAQLTRCGL